MEVFLDLSFFSTTMSHVETTFQSGVIATPAKMSLSL